MPQRDPSARGTSLMASWFHVHPGFRSEGQAWICRRASLEDLVNKSCWVSSPSPSFFEKKLGKREVKDGGGTEEGKQQDQRASTSSLHSASCPASTYPVLPQETQGMMRHIWCSQRHHSFPGCPALLDALPAPSSSHGCAEWGWNQGQGPSEPHSSSAPTPAAKTLLGPPSIPLGVVVYFS